jgi:oxygen-independent coproporphyrinogen-3 oxidase
MVYRYQSIVIRRCVSYVAPVSNRFGIYLHIPFCVHKCSYCDFYSFTKYSAEDFSLFNEALIQELRSAATWLRNGKNAQPVSSVFFGGGTPSLYPVPLLKRIFDVLQEEFSFHTDIEITLEANPETVTEKFCNELKEKTPINRISLGAQSFQADNLKKLERLGSRQSIHEAARLLKQAGYTNFNLDFIFAIPGQKEADLLSDLEEASSLEPKHISAYNLTLKPGHILYSSLPEDDSTADLYETAVSKLKSLGFNQYEISNYSKPGFECAHNLLYWDGGDYLGIGPSASSRFFWEGKFFHRKQLSDFSRYLSHSSFDPASFETTTQDQTLLEATFLEIRRNEGIQLESFKNKYGYAFQKGSAYGLLMKEKMIEESRGVLKLTDRGRLLADSVSLKLLE